MTQRELNRAVAQATGESVSTIAGLGFVPLTGAPAEDDPEDYSLDWDELESERAVRLFSRRRRNALIA